MNKHRYRPVMKCECVACRASRRVFEPMSPGERRQLEDFYAANPERRPSPVRRLSRSEIEKLYPKERK